eukprot:359621-Rhodomonas_salina.5
MSSLGACPWTRTSQSDARVEESCIFLSSNSSALIHRVHRLTLIRAPDLFAGIPLAPQYKQVPLATACNQMRHICQSVPTSRLVPGYQVDC